MKFKHILFAIFALIIIFAFVYGFATSRIFAPGGADAVAFGISPPFLRAENLAFGERAERRLFLLKHATGKSYAIEVSADPPELMEYVEVPREEELVFEGGEERKEVKIFLKLPEKSYRQQISGSLRFALVPQDRGSGATVGVGAQADVLVSSAMPALDEKKPITDETYVLKPSALYNRLKGGLVIKVEDRGKAYYIDETQLSAMHIGDAGALYDFFKIRGGYFFCRRKGARIQIADASSAAGVLAGCALGISNADFNRLLR